jgi:hypothetical protein
MSIKEAPTPSETQEFLETLFWNIFVNLPFGNIEIEHVIW